MLHILDDNAGKAGDDDNVDYTDDDYGRTFVQSYYFFFCSSVLVLMLILLWWLIVKTINLIYIHSFRPTQLAVTLLYFSFLF